MASLRQAQNTSSRKKLIYRYSWSILVRRTIYHGFYCHAESRGVIYLVDQRCSLRFLERCIINIHCPCDLLHQNDISGMRIVRLYRLRSLYCFDKLMVTHRKNRAGYNLAWREKTAERVLREKKSIKLLKCYKKMHYALAMDLF